MSQYRPADPLGIQRSIKPVGVLPQQADQIDPSLPLAEDELLISVESLNIDSASFHQMSEFCEGDLAKLERHIIDLVKLRGKLHNPVTGSGGMLIGTVTEIGPKFPINEKPVKVGDRIATLVSLSLTPLEIKRVKAIFSKQDKVDVEANAILFASGVFSILPSDIPDAVSLAVLDVAGAPAQTRKLTRKGDTVVVIGGGGKSGVLCLYEAKKAGAKTIAVDYSNDSIARLKKLSFVDEIIELDARKALAVREAILQANQNRLADLVINVANIPETEMSCILSAKPKGIVYFFSMATSFTRAALGAEGVGADLDLRIGNGYTEGHAELCFQILRESGEILELFTSLYA